MQLLTVIIPAFNEVGCIRTTIQEVLDHSTRQGLASEIIVSADGTDGTRETARAMAAEHRGIRVIGGPRRGGKGRAIREAVALAKGDVIGFIDADNKTPITEFEAIRLALDRGADVAIGSRRLQNSRIERPQPLYRRIGSRGFALFLHAVVGLGDLSDTQCGFKFFKRDVARDLFAIQQIDGYMFDVEILYLARLRGYRIDQVAVRWRDDGDSRLDLVTGNLRNVRDVLSIRSRHRALAGAMPRSTDARQSPDG